MGGKILVAVTEEEKDVVEELYERISSLKSLIISLSQKKLESNEQEFFYKKILSDWYNTKKIYECWWQNTADKYNLPKNDIGRLYMDFEKKEIYSMD
ncbi:CXXX repeat peptide modification system protein [Clostridium botulinum]|uniref:CXXX repeat peptide modification system protein n=1 Tax=Clostridium botulinum TaxID=1491 RepID=UPI001375F91A|nr:CXXX repeat peptide modification system protein [Clostridium botulinum]MCC5418033.1 CXXX repeat peptide modification system protein [Clostridium botulinum]NCI19030.1 CXXX repeat peptide modification system protein [Clostridium botulinum]NCI35442.1 CXXX repeat peptide modification system protein [Clostridium botulinum]NCI75053.1 CXXX repeat peptide modification system protein [Clostridium botulinum]NDI38072.1 CXXX repeat peptide modification system protein [Clostridium botulinum]